MPIPQPASRVLFLFAVALASSACDEARAGLSLEEALLRHRGLLGAVQASQNVPTASTPQLTLPDRVSLAVGGTRDTPPLLRREVDGRGGVQVLAGGGDPQGFAWRIGAGWSDSRDYRFNLDGSELSLAVGPGQAYVSNQRRHWGPSWAGSLILDQGAAPVPAIGWRKTNASAFANPWFAWLGTWNVDTFIGTLSGHDEPAHPRLWGLRFQFMPVDGLELGVSRVIEWGGRGRSESPGTFWKALIGHDNNDGGEYDPSNQLAGFDARYSLRLGSAASASVYGQAIGEDEAGTLPSRYLGSAGVDVAFVQGATSMRFLVERANTVMGGIEGKDRPGSAYRHGIYRQGYTNQRRPLGHPAGGDVVLNTVGALVDGERWSAIALLHRGSARSGAQLYASTGRLSGADVEVAWRLDAANRIGSTFTRWRDPVDTATGLQVWWRHVLR